MTVDEFARQLRLGHTSSARTTEDCLERIAALDPSLNAFIHVMHDEARHEARERDQELAAGHDRGPLHGVPMSIKDLFDVAGTVTTAASRVREGLVADADAALIARLRQAGAIIVGKTNLHEFAFGTTNEDSAFGPARNPHDPSRSPGGSSGGSAASVAAGMALATLGTDTGGSIRIPAAHCGIVGLKPTLGELPTGGVIPLSRTFDHTGPLAQTVTDAWHVFHALRGDTVVKPLSAPDTGTLTFGVPRAYFCDILDAEVRQAFERSLHSLRSAGARVIDVSIAHAPLTAAVYSHVSFGDAAAYHAHTLETMPERYTAPVRARLEMARYVLAEDYVRALSGREVLRNDVDVALSAVDALVLPTVPIPAHLIGETTVDIDGVQQPVRNMTLRLTQLFNITGHPALSIPGGKSAGGLPIGLQLVGTRNQTDTLLHVGRAVELALDAL
jgi:aspartyl-tRNA(Asn)/glutamyl-tRNA(Gln) amidotransferase subunit A